MTYTFMLSN
ncbi:hypothetical protein Z2947 [Escherichia coli O157:H7 str. EDL933]|uniref:Uncharacterized protein n=1 Tax=Escherichia coli O157:H7 TaxID=83334 RepID=Q8X4G1_ECO57|nr:hypothetical protein Z2947 [Escherichia coli O157:H7 str. EDL933]ACT72278.1 predicted protein [Escherichia coli O157:H7 str. TW14359]